MQVVVAVAIVVEGEAADAVAAVARAGRARHVGEARRRCGRDGWGAARSTGRGRRRRRGRSRGGPGPSRRHLAIVRPRVVDEVDAERLGHVVEGSCRHEVTGRSAGGAGSSPAQADANTNATERRGQRDGAAPVAEGYTSAPHRAQPLPTEPPLVRALRPGAHVSPAPYRAGGAADNPSRCPTSPPPRRDARPTQPGAAPPRHPGHGDPSPPSTSRRSPQLGVFLYTALYWPPAAALLPASWRSRSSASRRTSR